MRLAQLERNERNSTLDTRYPALALFEGSVTRTPTCRQESRRNSRQESLRYDAERLPTRLSSSFGHLVKKARTIGGVGGDIGGKAQSASVRLSRDFRETSATGC